MTTELILEFIKNAVDAKKEAKQYPTHYELRTLCQKATRELENYDEILFKETLRQLIKEGKLYFGLTCNDFWLSIYKNNVDE